MSSQVTRLELLIDVFDQVEQRALVLPTISRSDLVGSILQEFGELDFLGDNPDEYQLIKNADNTPLVDDKALNEQQLTNGQRLRFVEHQPPIPEGAHPPAKPIYLRDLRSGKVYKLHWVPAIIGRTDPDTNDNDRLAVNLESDQTGLRVSRRHASIVEEDGQFYVASLSQNPTSIQDSDGNTATISRRWKLQNGNIIHLDRSGISFKFIVREPTVVAAEPVVPEPVVSETKVENESTTVTEKAAG